MLVRGRDKPIVNVSSDERYLSLRIDFEGNLAGWVEINLTREELEKVLATGKTICNVEYDATTIGGD